MRVRCKRVTRRVKRSRCSRRWSAALQLTHVNSQHPWRPHAAQHSAPHRAFSRLPWTQRRSLGTWECAWHPPGFRLLWEGYKKAESLLLRLSKWTPGWPHTTPPSQPPDKPRRVSPQGGLRDPRVSGVLWRQCTVVLVVRVWGPVLQCTSKYVIMLRYMYQLCKVIFPWNQPYRKFTDVFFIAFFTAEP